jgi:Heparinase II/III N-terminus/Heparinase II/III-like protein
MRWALRFSVAFCIFLGSICPAFTATDPKLANQNTEAGEILTEQAATDLFNALDLARDGLGSVAVTWKRKDKALAQRELARYFRTRTSVGWKTQAEAIPHLSPQSRAVADGAVAGSLQGGLVPQIYSFPNGKIDWHFNATDHKPGEAHNDEWQWQLNRMSFWSDLAVAYRATGDEQYAEAFVQELRSWIAQCPVPAQADNGPGSAWRTIEAGIRSGGSWMDAFYAFRDSPAMGDEDLLALVHSLLDHARYLRSHHTRLNWLTMEMSGLYAVGAVFPEFQDAAEWRSFAANTLAEEGRKQFLADGAQMELSTGYQNVALDSFLHLAEIARWTGNAAELPPGYFAPLEKAYEWQQNIVAPDMYLPKINDSWPVYLPPILQKASTYFPSQPLLRWFASNRRDGAPPPFSSIFLDRSGLAAMRSDWNADANYLLFRVGPLGMGHQHQDSLGVEVWAYGRELIFNGGGGSYENSKWRQWAISAFAHNAVVVDDMTQTRPINQNDPFHDPNMVSQGPIDAHWQSNPVFDFASGTYAQGYGPSHKPIASQRRDILFIKPNIYVVADRLQPNDSLPHQYQARWQVLTTTSRIDPSTQTMVTEDRTLANIAIVPLLTESLRVNSVSGQEKPEILGWNFRKDEVPPLVPATTLLHTVSGSGPHLLLTLLIPLRPGATNPIARVEAGRDGASATVIFTDGRRLLISCPGSLGILAKETLPNGQAGRSITSIK